MKYKKIAVLGLFTVICIAFSFFEKFIPLEVILPGVRLGLANCVALIILVTGDIKGAATVNLLRILISALLFGTPVSFVFSLIGGIISFTVMYLLYLTDKFSVIGLSIAGGTAHNIGQWISAMLILKMPVISMYLPFLMICGAVCGLLSGTVGMIILRRIKNIKYFGI